MSGPTWVEEVTVEGADQSSVELVASGPFGDSSGHALSWLNQRHPGYPYPEITGYLLALLAGTRRHEERRASLVRALLAQPAAGVGRHGVRYAFDTGMALNGLLHEIATGTRAQDVADRADQWTHSLVGSIAARRAREPGVPLTEWTRWSDAFGCHQSKLALPLVHSLAVLGPREGSESALDLLLGLVLPLQLPDGRFRVHELASVTYVHSHCYALEGLVAQSVRPLAEEQRSSLSRALLTGADWLARVQAPSGGLRAWHDGHQSSGPVRTDATAQAARIWQLVSPQRYGAPLARAVDFLESLQTTAGGLPYEPGSDDVNTWATIFWAQVRQWRRAVARPAGLV